MQKRRKSATDEVVIQGIGVSPGVAVGPAFLVKREDDSVVERDIAPSEAVAEIIRLEDAVVETRRQILHIQASLGRSIGPKDANIFDVHLMVLDDGAFVEEAIRGIERDRRNAEATVRAVATKYADALARLEDEYLKERVADVKDVARRLLRNLAGRDTVLLANLKARSIIVAADLAPSETAMLRKELVLGFATEMGSAVSHSAIMARALKIPAAVGLHALGDQIESGQEVLLDGNKGLFIIRPTAERLAEYGKVIEARRSIVTSLTSLKMQPAVTKDGHRVRLMANIELVDETDEVRRQGAEGVGLYRTEYFYQTRRDLPGEAEQAEAYSTVAERLAPAPVTVRTADLGGDKLAPHLTANEINPFMGLRAIRLCLAQPDMFRTQLRAILRASRHGNVKIMYPMISTVSEVVRANELLRQSMDELRAEGVPFDERIPVGAMIELPSAAMTAEMIAEHVQFFSLGTNDLVQYTLAVDRVNDRVAHLYEPTHPAVLRLIARTIQEGHARGLPVSVCGEMAGDPVLALLLLGLGADELSMASPGIPMVKDAIRSITRVQANELALEALNMKSGAEILARCRDLARSAAPEILELMG